MFYLAEPDPVKVREVLSRAKDLRFNYGEVGATREGSDSHPLQAELVTCQVADGTCAVLASVAVYSEAPVLAR